MRYIAFGNTHVGKVREHNEDTFFLSDTKGFFLVSDGMGGLEGGEVAAAITKDAISEHLAASSWIFANPEKQLKEAFRLANKKVREALPDGKGMGCTCVTLLLHQNDFYIAYVGDSRIYLYRNGKLKQLTKDHSYVEELFTRGLISEEEKVDHPYKNSITRYIGHAEDVNVDVNSGPLLKNDIFLLCSDGLTGEVADDQISSIIAAADNPEVCVNSFIESALQHGGNDNVTAVVVKIHEKEAKKDSIMKKLFGW